MGSLYVVSGRSFYRAFTISSDEDSSESSIYHEITKINIFLDKVWPFSGNSTSEQSTISVADGQIGDRENVVVVLNDGSFKEKLYRRNFGVNTDYIWSEETDT